MKARTEDDKAERDFHRPPTADPDQGRVYYPGLDGLRAFAIAMVYAFHDHDLDLLGYLTAWVEVPLALAVDPLVEALGLPSVSLWARVLPHRLFRSNGWAGVQVFFVLSGFLITTLLLRERGRFGRVDLRAFWVRRALRIWPLYYLVVAIGFGIYPWLGSGTTPTAWRASYGGQLPAFLGFLGNWSMIQRGQMPDPISVLWSVCVEEQFYLFVPLLVGFLVPRWRVLALAALIGASVVGRYPQVETPVDEDPLAADRPIPGRVRRRSPRWRIARQSPRSIVDRSPERAGSDSRDLRTARFW